MNSHTPIHVVGYCSFGRLLFEKLAHLNRDKLKGYLYGSRKFKRKLEPEVLAGIQKADLYNRGIEKLKIGAGNFNSPASYIVETENHWNPSLVLLVIDTQDSWACEVALKQAEELALNGTATLAILIENHRSAPLGFRRRLLESVLAIDTVLIDIRYDALRASELACLEVADIVDGFRLLMNPSDQFQKFKVRDLRSLFAGSKYFRLHMSSGKDPAAIEDATRLLQVEGKDLMHLFEPKSYYFCMITQSVSFDQDEIFDILKDVNHMIGKRVDSSWGMQHCEELADNVLVEICLIAGNPLRLGLRRN